MSDQSTFVEHSFFTDHVRSNYTQHLDDVYEKLKPLLNGCLRRHRLTPGDLGYAGNSWHETATIAENVDYEDGATLENRSAMTELLDDCYTRVFITRDDKTLNQKEYMERKVHAGNSLEGLVETIVKQWLGELHAKKDPHGSAIFNNLRKALREMVHDPDSQLIVINGPDSKFDSETIFGIPESTADPIDSQTVATCISTDSTWQKVFKKVVQYGKSVQQLIKNAVQGMVNNDQLPFYFNDLLAAIKEKSYDPENLNLDKEENYDPETEKRQTFFRITRENEGYKTKEEITEKLQLAHLAVNQRVRSKPTKERLHKLLDLLEKRCFEEKKDLTTSEPKTIGLELDELEEELGIGRTTIYDYLQRLHEYYESVREQLEE